MISFAIRKIEKGKQFVRTFWKFCSACGVNICSVNLDSETTFLTLWVSPFNAPILYLIFEEVMPNCENPAYEILYAMENIFVQNVRNFVRGFMPEV